MQNTLRRGMAPSQFDQSPFRRYTRSMVILGTFFLTSLILLQSVSSWAAEASLIHQEESDGRARRKVKRAITYFQQRSLSAGDLSSLSPPKPAKSGRLEAYIRAFQEFQEGERPSVHILSPQNAVTPEVDSPSHTAVRPASSLAEEQHQNLLALTVLHPDIAPLIAAHLDLASLHAMGSTCRSAHSVYENPGLIPLTLNLWPLTPLYLSEQTHPRELLVPYLVGLLTHHRRAQEWHLTSPNLPMLIHAMREAKVYFWQVNSLSLPNTGVLGMTLSTAVNSYPNLTHVDVSNKEDSHSEDPYNQLESLAIFNRAHRLTHVNASYNQISSLVDLDPRLSLKSLILTGNPLLPTEWLALQHFPTLERLEFSWRYGMEEIYQLSAPGSLNFLMHLVNLTHLDLDGHNVEDASPLRNLRRLTHLNVARNSIANTSFLEALTNLQVLYIEANQITTLASLRAPHLEELNARDNRLTSADFLRTHPRLEYLNLARNQISSAEPLEDLTHVTYLDLTENPIGSLVPLKQMPHLKTLEIAGTGVSSFLPLVGMRELSSLNAAKNKIIDVGPLTGLTRLQKLVLSENPLHKVGPLKKMVGLKELHLDKVAVDDFGSLATLPHLGYLSLAHTTRSHEWVAQLPNLYALMLDHTGLTDETSAFLDELNLYELSVVGNERISRERREELSTRFPIVRWQE